jgi:hypothetical protein
VQAWTDQSGQATVEWSGVVLLLALALGGLLATASAVDGRSLGGALTHRITCVITRDCHDGDAALGKAYVVRRG